jgi:hypothetical protein
MSVPGSATTGCSFSPFDLDCAKALMTADRWIVRRVETIAFRDESEITRRLAVDFYVPSGAHGEAAPLHLPLALARKGARVAGIQLTDETGAAVPVLSPGENAGLSTAALGAALEFVLGSTASPALRGICQRLAHDAPDPATAAYLELSGILAERIPTASGELQTRLRRLALVARRMIGDSIVWLVNRDDPERRRIVTMTWATRPNGPSDRRCASPRSSLCGA